MATSGRAAGRLARWGLGWTEEGGREEAIAIGHNANAATESAATGAPPGLGAIWGGKELEGQTGFRRASFWLSCPGCLAGRLAEEDGGEEEEEGVRRESKIEKQPASHRRPTLAVAPSASADAARADRSSRPTA